MARLRVWTPILTAALVCGIGAAAPTHAPDWSALSDSIRPYVYLSVSELPPFPKMADSLDDVRRWPKYREFQGRKCILQFGTNQRGDVVGWGDVDSVWDVARDLSYHAGYSAIPSAQESLEVRQRYGDRLDPLQAAPRLGPRYSWRRDRRVGRRTYYWMDHFREYLSDSNGVTRAFFCDQAHSGGPFYGIYNSLYFSGEGGLLGFELGGIDSLQGARLKTPIRYWGGRPVTPKEYEAKRQEFEKSAWPEGRD